MKWYEVLWQLPQWLAGWLYLFFNSCSLANGFIYNGVRYYVLHGQRGSVSFCRDFVFLSVAAQDSDTTIRHEYGHTVQSRRLGWLYLPLVGLPSIVWAFVHRHFMGNRDYHDFLTAGDAGACWVSGTGCLCQGLIVR